MLFYFYRFMSLLTIKKNSLKKSFYFINKNIIYINKKKQAFVFLLKIKESIRR